MFQHLKDACQACQDGLEQWGKNTISVYLNKKNWRFEYGVKTVSYFAFFFFMEN